MVRSGTVPSRVSQSKGSAKRSLVGATSWKVLAETRKRFCISSATSAVSRWAMASIRNRRLPSLTVSTRWVPTFSLSGECSSASPSTP